MGGNRNNSNNQVRSRLSNNEGVADDDTDGDDTSEENDPYGEEPPEMRVTPEFLKNLPGVQASDSMAYRIEALRVYLENQLGEQPFIAAYQHFTNMNDNADDNLID